MQASPMRLLWDTQPCHITTQPPYCMPSKWWVVSVTLIPCSNTLSEIKHGKILHWHSFNPNGIRTQSYPAPPSWKGTCDCDHSSLLTLKALNFWKFTSYCSLKTLMVGHGGSSAGSYLVDPTSPIPSHCASIVATSTLRVNYCLW